VTDEPGRVLSVIICGAGPAADAGALVRPARQHGWTVQLIATPAAAGLRGRTRTSRNPLGC